MILSILATISLAILVIVTFAPGYMTKTGAVMIGVMAVVILWAVWR